MKLIDDLITYCQEEEIRLIIGDDMYQNAIADNVEYKDNELIMLAYFNVSPTVVNGRIVSEKYTGAIALGRKREERLIGEEEYENTQSSLDETFEQKYIRRISDLYDLLFTHLGSFTCYNEYIIDSAECKIDINKFDLNADFVTCAISIINE